jgi:hypothetical protein
MMGMGNGMGGWGNGMMGSAGFSGGGMGGSGMGCIDVCATAMSEQQG